MHPATAVLKAIDAATLAASERQEHRSHLGASIIGEECLREAWYKFRWAFPGQPHEPRMLRLFGRGQREELEFIKLLRGAGVVVYAAGESGELKDSLRISDVDGHFGGTPDGVGTNVPGFPSDLPVLLEFKTYKDNRFAQLKKDGVLKTSIVYYVQMQIYMLKLDLTHALFLAVNKNDDELHAEIIGLSKDFAERYLARAREVIYAEAPPPRIADSMARFPCKWCDFKFICHNEEFPAINCRTCCHATPVPGGKWQCARGNDAVAGMDQSGCAEHLYDPRWWDNWNIIDHDFKANWLRIDNGREAFNMGTGPGCTNSATLLKDGLVPF